MASKHIIKHTENEIVFKCYITESSGGNVDLSLENDMTKSTQVYTPSTNIVDETSGAFVEYTGSRVFFTGIWWGLKKDKQLDITRIVNPTGPVFQGHYYFIGAGSYEYPDFSDRVYANKDIRLIFDGPGHCILRLRKAGWTSKIETARFGSYDDETAVGS